MRHNIGYFDCKLCNLKKKKDWSILLLNLSIFSSYSNTLLLFKGLLSLYVIVDNS